MRSTSTALFALLVSLACGCGKKDKETPSGGSATPNAATPDDKSVLQGTWKTTKYEIEFPKEEKQNPFKELVQDIFGNLEITVKDSMVTATVKDPKGKEKDESKTFIFTLDSSKPLKQLDLTEADDSGKPKPSKKLEGFDPKTGKEKLKEGPPETILAIYKLEGDTLVVALGMGKENDRPKEFKATTRIKGKEDDGTIVLYFRKK